MDDLYEASLNGIVYWRLDDDSPKELALDAFPGWSLVVPFSDSARRYSDDYTHVVGKMPDGAVLLDTRVLILRGPSQTEGEGLPQLHHAFSVINQVLGRLRYLSKQAALPRNIASLRTGVQSVQDPRAGEITTINPSTYFWAPSIRNAVTTAHLSELAALTEAFVVPTYAEVMLDALQAWIESDYRKSILYSAMAIEIFAAQCLDGTYAELLDGFDDPRFRVVSIRENRDSVVRKDPVYEALRSREGFDSLLHAIPLYLLGKSLLIDDQDSYRNARRLYRTRNGIAHQGRPSEQKDCFDIDGKGAKDCLNTALGVLAWFGDKSNYTLPGGFENLAGERMPGI